MGSKYATRMKFDGFKVIKSREITEDRDGDSRSYLVTVAAPARTTPRALKCRLRRAYNTYCQHAYDCCGRWYATAHTFTLRKSKSGEWTFELSYSCNI